MRPHAKTAFFVWLCLGFGAVSEAQVIVRSVKPTQGRLSPDKPVPAEWSPGLQKAWTCLERIQANDETVFALRSGISRLLADQGQLKQAIAVAGMLEGLHRYLTAAHLATLTARNGQPELAMALYLEARKGLAFADLAGCQQIQAELAGAAAALGMADEVTAMLNQTTDPEHLATALGNALAAGEGRPESCPRTEALLKELADEDQEKFFVTRIYQARAVLHVAANWKISGIDGGQFLSLCEKSVRFAENKLLYTAGHMIEAAELLFSAGLNEIAESVLWKAREQAATGGGFERGPADLVDLARVWLLVIGENVAAEMHKRAWTALQSLDPMLKTEAAALLGGAFWRFGDQQSAVEAWMEAAASVSGNPNQDFIFETLARVAIEAARCGADRDESWAEKVGAFEAKAGVAGKEDA